MNGQPPATDAERMAVQELLGIGFAFSQVEDYDLAEEWAVRAYRLGQATTHPETPADQGTSVSGGAGGPSGRQWYASAAFTGDWERHYLPTSPPRGALTAALCGRRHRKWWRVEEFSKPEKFTECAACMSAGAEGAR